ncbi:MAG: helix-turn-helix domain-containing protein [Lachnospiraceae bacterium]
MLNMPLDFCELRIVHDLNFHTDISRPYRLALCKNSGDFLIFKPHANPEDFPCGKNFEAICILFRGALAQDFCEQTGFHDITVIPKENIRDYEKLYTLMQELVQLTQQETWSTSDELHIYVLFYKLLVRLHFCIVPEYDDEKQRQRTLLAPAFELIHNHTRLNDVSVQDMAALVHLSPTHFSRIFKEITGESPTQYVLQKRLRDSEKFLLNHPEMSVEEIATYSGFTSVNYYRQVFKQKYQLSPSEYRKEIQHKAVPQRITFIPYWQPLYVVNARNHEKKAAIDYSEIPPSAYRLSICTGGTGTVTTANHETYTLHRNDMFLNIPKQFYCIAPVTDTFSILEICFDGLFSQEILENFGIRSSICFTNIPDNEYDFVHNANYIWRNFWTWDKEALLECSVRIHDIVYHLHKIIQNSTMQIQGKDDRFATVLKFMELYYMNDLSIADLAETAGMQYTAFSKEFKRRYGQSPKKYLSEYRLNKAADMLLKYPSMKIIDIAKKNGFQDSSRFCITFREKFGVTPLEYRKRQ